MNIADKTVLITGANRGIGRALVGEALRRGAKTVYAGVRGALQIADQRVTPLALDVTNLPQIQQAAEQVDNLDVLINNAGVAIYDDLSNLDVIQQHMAVNFFGLLNVTRTFLPLLKRAKGAIVNNLSLAALAPLPILAVEGSRVQHDAVAEGASRRPGRDGPCRRPRAHRHRYEPRLRDTKGPARGSCAGNLRRTRERRGGDLSGPRIAIDRQWLAQRRAQGAGARVQSLRAAERGELTAEQNPDRREMVGASILELKKSPLAPMSFPRRPGLTHE
jgi:short chain dehydrogenase